MPRLLLATRNRGKLVEYRELLGDLPFQLTSLREEQITLEVEETGANYEENARLKAEAYARTSGLLTLADDSGLEVDSLGGEPGVVSARYGGPGLTDPERVQLLLRNLAQAPPRLRTARFVCVIAVMPPSGALFFVRGECAGVITDTPRGAEGFGYDPVFLFPTLGKTLAELSMEEKNAVSHRGNAARAARAVLLSHAVG